MTHAPLRGRTLQLCTLSATFITLLVLFSGTAQAQAGACCLSPSGCAELDPGPCGMFGGSYLGAGTVCEPDPCNSGACCAPGGCLDDQSESSCVDVAGMFVGDSTLCTPDPCVFGACCDAGGGCDTISEAACAGGAGDYQGSGTNCSPSPCGSGSCCTDSGCIDGESAASCLALGGSFEGNGSSCGPRLVSRARSLLRDGWLCRDRPWTVRVDRWHAHGPRHELHTRPLRERRLL